LALGLAETGSTFFEMAEGADSGPILSQDRIAIAPEDDAATLYSKVEATARRQLRQLIQQLLAGIAKPVPQSEALATHWRKRGKSDGRIDWRMPAVSIHNLVRALVRPYPGAHFDHKNTEVKVWKTSVGKQGYIDMEPGFVLGLDAERLHVQCGGGSTIHLVAHELRSPVSRGDYL
jgi:methionyl-tRNA formyltransferase